MVILKKSLKPLKNDFRSKQKELDSPHERVWNTFRDSIRDSRLNSQSRLKKYLLAGVGDSGCMTREEKFINFGFSSVINIFVFPIFFLLLST